MPTVFLRVPISLAAATPVSLQQAHVPTPAPLTLIVFPPPSISNAGTMPAPLLEEQAMTPVQRMRIVFLVCTPNAKAMLVLLSLDRPRMPAPPPLVVPLVLHTSNVWTPPVSPALAPAPIVVSPPTAVAQRLTLNVILQISAPPFPVLAQISVPMMPIVTVSSVETVSSTPERPAMMAIPEAATAVRHRVPLRRSLREGLPVVTASLLLSRNVMTATPAVVMVALPPAP
ncbi:MAG: hypothetical protein Greene101449_659 [Candidatus Peregrinibacteria bacterium Greene1014_49]|nr:MAG: hypothetical protein Greene101449_659 [Candidatus Peregrinibacteria bacterium Greene1014_49]